MTDPFAMDAQRRQALMERVEEVRLALYMAHDKQDGAAALKALADAYQLLDRIDGSQLLYVGGDERAQQSVAFALPATARELVAQFGGWCKLCNDRFEAGTLVYFDTSDRKCFCTRCSLQDLLGQR